MVFVFRSSDLACTLTATAVTVTTVANVGAGKFPLARPLILVTDSRPSALAKNFIRFAQSTSVHDLVEGLSYVPIKE